MKKKSVRIKTTDFSDLSIPDFADKMAAIVQAILANLGIFGPLPISEETLNGSLQKLRSDISDATEGSREDRNQRDEQYSVCLAYVYRLAAHVANIASAAPTTEGEEDIIELAKFTVVRQGSRIGELPAPANIRSTSLSRAIEVEFDSVRGSKSYVLYYTVGLPSENSVWSKIEGTRTKFVLDDCVPGQVMSFKAYALGAAGLGQPSAIISDMAKF